MEIKITYEEAQMHHPELVDILIGKMQASRVRDKNKPAKDWEWYYSYGMTVRKETYGEEKTTQSIINEQLSSVLGLSLAVAIGRTRRYFVFPEKPKFFVQKFSDMVLKSIGENGIAGTQDETSEIIKTKTIKVEQKEEIEYDLDLILEKISKDGGVDNLTSGEKAFLESHSA